MRIVLEVEEVLSVGSNADSAFSDDAGAFGGQAAQNHAQTDFDTPEDLARPGWHGRHFGTRQ